MCFAKMVLDWLLNRVLRKRWREMIQILRRILIAIIWIVATPFGFGIILTPILIDSVSYPAYFYYIFGFSILAVAYFLHRIINRILMGSLKEEVDFKKSQLDVRD